MILPDAVQAATYIVNNRLDAGAGSLREAITNANNTPDTDFIEFNPLFFNQPRTITLLTGELEIGGGGVTIINAPGADLLTIDAEGTGGIFFVNSSANAIINGVTVTGGEDYTRAVDVEGRLQIINSVITGNFGGLGVGEFSNGGFLTVRNCVISNNSGAGIESVNSLNNDSEVTLVNSVISGDGSFQNGGGLTLRGPSRVENVLITGVGRSSDRAVVDIAGDYTINIINTTISDNAYGETGIKVRRSATVNFLSSTNTNGVDRSSTITAGNSIFAIDLTHPYGYSFNGRLNSLGYNLIENTEFATIVGDMTGNILNVNPQLAPLTDNGGIFMTHKPLAGSPLIDAGDPENFPPFDGRGFLRPFDGDGNGAARTDIGAVEFGASAAQTGTFTGRTVSGSIRTSLTAIAHIIGKDGFKRSVKVNPSGYFRFAGLPADQSYIVYFQTKSGNVAPKTVSVNTTEGVIEF